jgi:threonine/homoserine/homoserine lactone efflux protein
LNFFLLKGALTGLMIGLLVGPIVITMVETAIFKGKKTAFIFGIGVWLSDALYIYLTHLGLSVFLSQENVKVVLGIGGGILLLAMGTYNFFYQSNGLPKSDVKISDKTNAFIKGIIINVFNPFVIAMWIGIYAYLQNQEATGNDKLYYFIGFMGMIVILDSSRIWIATKVKRFLSGERIKVVKKLAGLGLMIFGIVMLYRILS